MRPELAGFGPPGLASTVSAGLRGPIPTQQLDHTLKRRQLREDLVEGLEQDAKFFGVSGVQKSNKKFNKSK